MIEKWVADLETNLPQLQEESSWQELLTYWRKSTANYQQIAQAVEQSVNLIVITDTNGQITYVNPKFSQITGYSLEEAVGKTPAILKSGHTSISVYEDLWQTILAGDTWRGEFKNRTKHTTIYWAAAVISPIKNKAGQITHFLSVQEDITAQKKLQAEQAEMQTALQEAEAQYHRLVDNVPVGLFRVTTDGQWHQVNPALAELMGMSDPSEIGPDLPDGVTLSRWLEFLEIVPQRGQITDFEMELGRADRQSRWVALSGRAVPAPPGINSDQQWVEGTVTDITLSKQIEAELLETVQQQQAAEQQNARLLVEAERRTERLQVVAEVSQAASQLLEATELVTTAVNLIRERFGFYYVGLFLVEEDYAVLKAGTGEAGERQLAKNHRLKLGGGSMIGWSVEHKQARIALDVGEDAVHFKNPDLPLTRSEMALPLVSRGEPIGALTIQSEEERAFSDEDITLLQTMADQLALAIDNAHRYQQSQQAALRESSIKEITSRVRASTHIDPILETALNELRQALPQAEINLIRRESWRGE